LGFDVPRLLLSRFALLAMSWLPNLLPAQRLPQAIYWTRYYLRLETSPRTSLHWEADNRRFFSPVGGQHQFISHLHAHRAFYKRWEGWLGFSYSIQFAQRPEAPPPTSFTTEMCCA
jgi:hypothetical protein